MNLYRVWGIMMQELYITMHSIETINDIFFIALINFLLFGFLSTYLLGSRNSQTGQFLILGMLLWEIVRIVQYSISVGSLWNIWSRNLSNLFISPLSILEYLTAHTLSGIVKGLLVFGMASIAAIIAFHFNIYQIGLLNLLFIIVNLMCFSFATGIILLGIIFKFGTRVQALTWAIIHILQPITAVFYPVHIMPLPLQFFSYMFPTTFVFEAARANLLTHQFQWTLLGIAFIENVIYIALAVFIFERLFISAKMTGQFARNQD